MDKDLLKREIRLNRYLPKLEEIGLLFKSYKTNLDYDFIGLDTPDDITYIKKEYVEFVINRYQELYSSPFKGLKNSIKVYLSNEKTYQILQENELYKLDSILRRHISFIKDKMKKVQYSR